MKKMEILDQVIEPGEQKTVKIVVARLPSDTKITIQAHVFRSKIEGPTVLIIGGVHGDEINGIEIVRRFLSSGFINKIQSGNVIVIPVLNVYGFINFNRFVPDGKDVNRSFPGALSGSLASRIANTLTKNILPHVDYILDFHTGSESKFNYPQIRFNPLEESSRELAYAFDAPFLIEAGLIPKSLRRIARDMGKPTIVYEGGESVRLSKISIERGLSGLTNCLAHLNVFPDDMKNIVTNEPKILIKKISWLRAPYSGIFLWSIPSGSAVTKGEILGMINDPNGHKSIEVLSHKTGYIIGHNNASVVNQGDALFHIGYESEIL